jgi:hypothetical protein
MKLNKYSIKWDVCDYVKGNACVGFELEMPNAVPSVHILQRVDEDNPLLKVDGEKKHQLLAKWDGSINLTSGDIGRAISENRWQPTEIVSRPYKNIKPALKALKLAYAHTANPYTINVGEANAFGFHASLNLPIGYSTPLNISQLYALAVLFHRALCVIGGRNPTSFCQFTDVGNRGWLNAGTNNSRVELRGGQAGLFDNNATLLYFAHRLSRRIIQGLAVNEKPMQSFIKALLDAKLFAQKNKYSFAGKLAVEIDNVLGNIKRFLSLPELTLSLYDINYSKLFLYLCQGDDIPHEEPIYGSRVNFSSYDCISRLSLKSVDLKELNIGKGYSDLIVDTIEVDLTGIPNPQASNQAIPLPVEVGGGNSGDDEAVELEAVELESEAYECLTCHDGEDLAENEECSECGVNG